MFKWDEEVYSVVVFVEGFGFCVWLDLYCYWYCYVDFYFFFVVILNVFEKLLECGLVNLFVVVVYKKDDRDI